ncbi:MAG: class II fructose-bisphosphate aldolase, partial [Nitrospinota bacterium]|nr:class II fructose-bisphosphate aldolase [Nitrospinota bacterium]
RPAEYAASILAGAIKEGYRGPVFLQGDHFQINAKKFAQDSDQELDALRNVILEALKAGFYNIDIDSSTLVDLSRTDIKEQQRMNFEPAAELTRYIREHEPEGVTVSVGGEVGEVGGKNTTVEEARAFIENYRETLASCGGGMKGISKLSIQTGTSHGGILLADGTMAQVSIDFDTLAKISNLCRESYGLSGAVQHGASTLPDEAFNRLVESGASEVHLATAFQNLIYDRVPEVLRDEVRGWVIETYQSSRKEGDTDEQLFYRERKRAFGPFKLQFSVLPEEVRAPIRVDLEDRFGFLFEKLGVVNTREAVDRFVNPVEVSIPAPAALS